MGGGAGGGRFLPPKIVPPAPVPGAAGTTPTNPAPPADTGSNVVGNSPDHSWMFNLLHKNDPAPYHHPTDASGQDLGYDPNRANDPFGVGPQQTDPGNATQQFDYLSRQVGNELGRGGYDPNRAEGYYQQADAPIQSDFYNQSQSTANYLARQGLGSSGINVSNASSLAGNKAALESQARLKSTELAREARRRELLDQFSTQAMGLQPVLQNKGIDVGLRIAQMQYDAQMRNLQGQIDSGYGQLAGEAIGAGVLLASDERVKQNISEGPPGGWKEFEYKPETGLPPGRRIGVIAQEIEDEYPDCVVEVNGIKHVNYARLAMRRGEK
jgi:hypothetical protein